MLMPGSAGAGAWRLRSELAEVDAVDRRRVTVLLGRSRLLCLHSLTAIGVAGVDAVLAVMATLGGQTLALCTSQILAHFSAGQGRFEACIRGDKFSLLSKSGTSSSKHGNSSDQFLDVHGVLQRLVSDSGLGGQGMVAARRVLPR